MDNITQDRITEAERKAAAAIIAGWFLEMAEELKRDNDAHERMRVKVARAYSATQLNTEE